jgi:hypothetical protein
MVAFVLLYSLTHLLVFSLFPNFFLKRRCQRVQNMTTKLSAGVLLFRVGPLDAAEVLIAHMGGPFWAKKDEGGWSVPKGEYVDGDNTFAKIG